MNKKYLPVFILAIIVSSCLQQNKSVTIRAIVDNKMMETEVAGDITELVFRIGQSKQVQKVEGVEKLQELRKLNMQMGGDYSDYSFLKNLKKLQILVINECVIDNLDFLTNMPNLEVLFLEHSDIYKNEIDLQNNKKIRYLSIYGVIFKTAEFTHIPTKPFVPNIKNIPESLEYLKIDRSPLIMLSKEFLTKLIKVPYVILDDTDLEIHREELQNNDNFAEVHRLYIDNWDFIQTHSNFILKDPKLVLPEKYQDKTIFPFDQWMKEDIWPKMKEVH